MKTKLIAAVLALASGAAMAAAPTNQAMNGETGVAFCTGSAGAAEIRVNATAPEFIQATFLQGCSNNVFLNVAENNEAAWGASGSKKGKYYMIGNTNGGAPRATTTAIPASGDPDPSGSMGAAKALNINASS